MKISNKLYDILKWLIIIVLPAAGTLYAAPPATALRTSRMAQPLLSASNERRIKQNDNYLQTKNAIRKLYPMEES